jgi:hypothetical protein
MGGAHSAANGWKPGQSGNPNGRPAGSRNNRTQEVLELIRSAGHQDPLITLAELQAKSSDEAIRATAANMLAPYLHSKNATKPVAPDPVYFEAEALPRPKSIAQACDNIALLTEMKSTGKMDVATADSLITDQRYILDALVDEAKLIAANGDPNAQQRIVIAGGLPELPGTSIILPQFNGHETVDEAGNPIPPEAANEEPKPPLSGDGSLPVNHDHNHNE